jgi:hypothetical protein
MSGLKTYLSEYFYPRALLVMFSFAVAVFFALPVYAQNDTVPDIELRTYVASGTVPLNQEVIYYVELRWPGELGRFRILEVLDPSLSNLEVRGTGSSNKVILDDAGNPTSIKRIIFYFRPLELGMAYVNGVTVRYTDTESGGTENLVAQRIEIKITEPVHQPGAGMDISRILGYLLLLLIIAGTVTVTVRFLKRRKAALDAETEAIPESPEQRYQRLLKETIHMRSDNYRESVSALGRLLGGYLSERYEFPVSGMATKDQLQILQAKNVDADNRARIELVLNRADMVKFAGESIEHAEFHSLYDTVELILQRQEKLFAEEKE